MKQIQLVIPMSGQGRRFQEAGFTMPKPMVPINNKTIIERLLEKFPTSWPATFVLAENHQSSGLPELLLKLRPEAKLVYVEFKGQGPGHALLEALPYLQSDQPIFCSYCDYGMIWDSQVFEEFVLDSECDACVLSYRGSHPHYLSPVTYAYSALRNDIVVQVKEKGSFSEVRENEFASCGAYYFKNKKLLQKALDFQFKHNLIHNGEAYTSLTVEALLQSCPGSDVRVFEIPYFFQWGTPHDLLIFEYWERTFKAKLRSKPLEKKSVSQVLMPMAGLGSRFSSITEVPKPFIEIDDQPMFLRALNSLPGSDKKTSIVSLAEHQKYFNEIEVLATKLGLQNSKEFKVTALEKTPPGQAYSVQKGIATLEEEGDIVVSSCDHEIVLSPTKWAEFKKISDADAAIFTIQGFPGILRSPQSYSYVITADKDHSLFPKVESVSVKKTTCKNPQAEKLLVGTFWFKDKKTLQDSLQSLIHNPTLVNNELYLDSIFNNLILANKTVRIIPLDGYINWGDPDSMSEALYWSEVFLGHSMSKRKKLMGVEK
jgi:NDP-sugar pyrophosphorylase family protein